MGTTDCVHVYIFGLEQNCRSGNWEMAHEGPSSINAIRCGGYIGVGLSFG